VGLLRLTQMMNEHGQGRWAAGDCPTHDTEQKYEKNFFFFPG
jgi:hypothetical protein